MPTKTTYRQTASRLIGPFHSSTATSGSTTAQLEDTAWPMQTSLSVDDLYKDQYLYLPTAAAADRVRLIDSYLPSTGVLIPDLSWGAAPTNGQAYEIHGIIEPLTLMTQLLNDALRILVFVNDEITFTPTANVRRHALTTPAPWIKDRNWVRQGGWLDSSDSRNETDPFEMRPLRGEVQEVGGTYYLWTPTVFTGTETVYLRVMKPAYYHCRVAAGTFGGQSGLSLESDECSVDENWVAAAVRVLVWDRLNNLLAPGNSDQTKRERAESAQAFNFLTRQFFKPYEMTFQPLVPWGPIGGVAR